MSWVQFKNETWPATPQEAQLEFHVYAPDVGCPRVRWRLELMEIIRPKESQPEPKNWERSISVSVSDMLLPGQDWRRLSNQEIRADAAWHATQEFLGPYGGSHNAPRVEVMHFVNNAAAKAPPDAELGNFIAHDFVLRFGTRDGLMLPCEIDAWVIPAEDYYRNVPETPAEVAKFPDRAPDLRVITRAKFIGATLDLPRCGTDPLPYARQIARGQLGCDEFVRPSVHWMSRSNPEHKEIVTLPPGWRSSVHFFTTPPE